MDGGAWDREGHDGEQRGASRLQKDMFCIEKQIPVTVSLAVFGLVAGEAGSALFVLIFFLLFHEFHENAPVMINKVDSAGCREKKRYPAVLICSVGSAH